MAGGGACAAANAVGYLSTTPNPDETGIAAFRGGLGEMGFVEGRNVVIEFRFAGGHYDSLPTLAADLVARQVAVIAVVGIAPALAARAATSQIPIIFVTGEDPVQLGLVSNLNRPDGNVTGICEVAALAASAGATPMAAMTATWRATKLAANVGRLS